MYKNAPSRRSFLWKLNEHNGNTAHAAPRQRRQKPNTHTHRMCRNALTHTRVFVQRSFNAPPAEIVHMSLRCQHDQLVEYDVPYKKNIYTKTINTNGWLYSNAAALAERTTNPLAVERRTSSAETRSAHNLLMDQHIHMHTDTATLHT